MSSIFILMRCLQVFDEADELKSKVKQLAAAVKQANHLVVYTGAGISTVRRTFLPLCFCDLKVSQK